MFLKNDPYKLYNKSRKRKDRAAFCWAAAKNLYMENTGQVLVCCYNRDYVLGRYPEKSINEIWSGTQHQAMVAQLKNYSEPPGCHLCFDAFRQKDYHNIKALEYDYLSKKNHFPAKLELELSNLCNLKCIMCSENFSSKFNPEGNIRQAPIKNLAAGLSDTLPYLEWINFSGGEPFLIKPYYELWEAAATANPACSLFVQSNGTIMNTEIEKIVRKGNFFISLSVDSIDKKNYETIRVNANLETTLTNVMIFNRLMHEKGRNLSITVCPMTINRLDIADLYLFCNEHNIRLLFHNFIAPKNLAMDALSIPQLEEVVQKMTAPLSKKLSEPIHLHNREKIEHLSEHIQLIIDKKRYD